MGVDYISHIPELGKLYGAYSPASRITTPAEFFSIAGQFGSLPDGQLPGDGSVYAQTKQCFANLGKVLAALHLSFTDILRFNTFLVDRSSIQQFMAARLEVFAEIYADQRYPPNTLVLVNGLVEEAFQVEIEALAVKSSG